MTVPTPVGYAELLSEIKERVRAARTRAAVAVNSELILLYWQIGSDILVRMRALGWGASVVLALAEDLRTEFPELKGFSARNLNYMKQLAECWPDTAILPQVVAKLPWGHHRLLLDRVRDPAQRLWYARAAVQHGWSRSILDYQIDSDLYRRQGSATTNFERTLPQAQSELAAALLKDPYNFDFLGLAEDARERDVHRGLLQHLREFLLELGAGFAFVGSEVHLEVAGDDFYIDLLFYHLRLRCFVVIELKSTDFKPEYAGKLNFYLSAVDDIMRHRDDQPSIGLIICRGRNGLVAEYALRDLGKPIGIASHQLRQALPEQLRGQLPTIEELEAALGDDP